MTIEAKNQVEQEKNIKENINLINNMSPEEIKDFLNSPEGKKLNEKTGKALTTMLIEHKDALTGYKKDVSDYQKKLSKTKESIKNKEDELKALKKQNKEVKTANKANIKPSKEVPKKEIEDKKTELKELKSEYKKLSKKSQKEGAIGIAKNHIKEYEATIVILEKVVADYFFKSPEKKKVEMGKAIKEKQINDEKEQKSKDVLLQVATPEFFNEKEYGISYNTMFDKAELLSTKERELDEDVERFQRHVISYANTANDKLITKGNVQIDYKTIEETESDPMLASYTEGTKIIKISNNENMDAPLTKDLYIFFGTKEEEYQNKAKEDAGKVHQIDDEGQKIKDKTSKLDINSFNYAGHIALKNYLKDKPIKYIRDNMENIQMQIEDFGNKNFDKKSETYTHSDIETIENGLYTAFIETIIERSTKDDHDLMTQYIKIINPGNNQRELNHLGSNIEEQRKNLKLIQDFAEKNLTADTEGNQLLKGQIAIIDSRLSPASEKQIGLIQSVMNILQGDFENTNPMIRKLFFMIAELFGGKARLAEKFPNRLDKIDDFYSKEFSLSAEKKDAIDVLKTGYETAERATFKKEDYSSFRSTFDEKNHTFNVVAFQSAFNKLEEKQVKQLDPQIIQDIIKRKKIQGAEKIITTNNTESKPQVDFKVFEKISEELGKEIFKDEKTLKSVKNAIVKSGKYQTYILDEKGNKKKITAKNKDILAINEGHMVNGFSAYLMAGSKEHFHNVLTENDFENKAEEVALLAKQNAEDNENMNKGLEGYNTSLTQSKDAITKAQKLDKAKDKKDKSAEEILADEERITKAQENHEKQIQEIFPKIFSHQLKDKEEGGTSMYNNLIKNLAVNKDQYGEVVNKENILSYLNQLKASKDPIIETKEGSNLDNAIAYLTKGGEVAFKDGKVQIKGSGTDESIDFEPGCFLTEAQKTAQQKAIDAKKAIADGGATDSTLVDNESNETNKDMVTVYSATKGVNIRDENGEKQGQTSNNNKMVYMATGKTKEMEIKGKKYNMLEVKYAKGGSANVGRIADTFLSKKEERERNDADLVLDLSISKKDAERLATETEPVTKTEEPAPVVETEPEEDITIANKTPNKIKKNFIKLKNEILKAKDNEYVGEEEGPGFIKINNEIFYNSQGKKDNTRGKIDENNSWYGIFNNQAIKVADNDEEYKNKIQKEGIVEYIEMTDTDGENIKIFAQSFKKINNLKETKEKYKDLAKEMKESIREKFIFNETNYKYNEAFEKYIGDGVWVINNIIKEIGFENLNKISNPKISQIPGRIAIGNIGISFNIEDKEETISLVRGAKVVEYVEAIDDVEESSEGDTPNLTEKIGTEAVVAPEIVTETTAEDAKAEPFLKENITEATEAKAEAEAEAEAKLAEEAKAKAEILAKFHESTEVESEKLEIEFKKIFKDQIGYKSDENTYKSLGKASSQNKGMARDKALLNAKKNLAKEIYGEDIQIVRTDGGYKTSSRPKGESIKKFMILEEESREKNGKYTSYIILGSEKVNYLPETAKD